MKFNDAATIQSNLPPGIRRWKETACASRTYQAMRDIGSVKAGELVTRFSSPVSYWVTQGLGGRKIRMITEMEFSDVRGRFYAEIFNRTHFRKQPIKNLADIAEIYAGGVAIKASK